MPDAAAALTWQSDAPSVATVDSTGRIRAIAAVEERQLEGELTSTDEALAWVRHAYPMP